MKIIFFGTSQFGVPALAALKRSTHKVLAVVTQPDRRGGRGRKTVIPTPVKRWAERNGLSLYQPSSLREPEAGERLRGLSPDLLVVAAYGQILPSAILKIPRRFALNIHPSLLPEYRGAAPISWALIRGERESGVTIIKMNERVDAGDIILQKRVAIAKNDNAIILNDKLSRVGARLLLETIKQIENGKAEFSPHPQDEKSATLAPRLTRDDARIDWRRTAAEIHNQIRGLAGGPGSFAYFQGKRLKIWQSEIEEQKLKDKPGRVVRVLKDKGILVACGRGGVLLKEVQPEGKKRMPVREYLLGHRLKAGDMEDFFT